MPFFYSPVGVGIAINVYILMAMVFALLYKRIDNGKLQWPRTEEDVRSLTQQELRWLLEGLSLSQPKAIMNSAKGIF